MGTKLNPGDFDCYANAAPDEPMFVLLARDKHAPTLVWLWATLRELDGENPAKVREARDCVMAMLEWQKAHNRVCAGLGQAGLAAMMELMRAANYSFKNADAATQDAALRMFLAASEIEAPPRKETTPSGTDSGRPAVIVPEHRTYPPPPPPDGYWMLHTSLCSTYRAGETAERVIALCDCEYEYQEIVP